MRGRVSSPESFIASILAKAFLVGFELIKEVTEEVMRAISDRKINDQEYT